MTTYDLKSLYLRNISLHYDRYRYYKIFITDKFLNAKSIYLTPNIFYKITDDNELYFYLISGRHQLISKIVKIC